MIGVESNPFSPVDPDDEQSTFIRDSVVHRLDSLLLHSRVTPNVCIIGERGMGAVTAVHHFVSSRAEQMPLRLIECDIKTHLPTDGTSATAFYQALAKHTYSKLTLLSPAGHEAANRIMHYDSNTRLWDIEGDLWTFFQEAQNTGAPLLFVIYDFDILPRRFTFKEFDWELLRRLYDELSIHYLVVTRRPLSYVVKLHKLSRSLFQTRFHAPHRVGLLGKDQILQYLSESIPASCGCWEEWLTECISEWSGGNPFCVRYLCFELFDRIWQGGEILQPENISRLQEEFEIGLREYFGRLYISLEEDGLSEALVQAIALDESASIEHVEVLNNLGYFLPKTSEDMQHMPFSPLFYNYLAWRGALVGPKAADQDTQKQARITPAVQRILNLPKAPPEITAWCDSWCSKHSNRRDNRDADMDPYVELYLAGYDDGLSEDELKALRLRLFHRYYYSAQDKGNRRTMDTLRANFYSRCDRLLDKYRQDAA